MTELSTLLSDQRWLERMVYRLVAKEHADEVLQETWIAARQKGHSVRRPRAWLTRVAKSLGARWIRDERARLAREQEYARTQANTELPTDELVARMEEHRRVAETVLALAEPYRSTMLAHFMDSLTTKEIAERTDVPWATVRGRLATGIEKMRQRFGADDEHGWRDRLALCVFGVPAARVARVARPRTALVSSKALLIGIALLMCAGISIVLSGQFDSDAVADPGPDDPTVAVSTPSGIEEDPTPRRAVVIPTTEKQSTEQPSKVLAIHGDILDLRGRPVAGLTLRSSDGRAILGKSNQDGKFDISLPNDQMQIQVDKGYTLLYTKELDPAAANRLVVTPTIQIRGTTIDRAGNPVSGADITYSAGTPVGYPHSLYDFQFHRARIATRSDSTGHFELRVPWMNGANLSARAGGHMYSGVPFGADHAVIGEEVEEFAEVEAGGQEEPPARETTPGWISLEKSVTVQFVLGKLRSDASRYWVVEGRVTDSTGKPIPKAIVCIHPWRTISAPDGHYRIDTTSTNLLRGSDFVAWHRDHGGFILEDPREQWQSLGTKHVRQDLRLVKAEKVIEGVIVDAAGHPLENHRVFVANPAVCLQLNGELQTVETTACRTGVPTDAEGHFELGGVLDRSYELLVLNESTLQLTRTRRLGPAERDISIVVPAPVDLQPAYEGRVVDVAGRAIIGADVRVAIWAARA